MPVIFDLLYSILIGVGFFFVGEFIVTIFRFSNAISYISNPTYQYPIIGISFFLFILFPLFLLGIFNNSFFALFSYLLAVIGFIGFFLRANYFYNFININKKKIIKFSFFKILATILLLLYFLISLSPVTSADSLSYHLSVAKFINKNGIFPTDEMDFSGKLSGIGEFLNTFAISIKAEQFTSFINFLGLVAILGIITKFSEDEKIGIENKCFLMLLVLSCPSLIFLISSSKPQFHYLSLVFFSYSFLIILNKIIKRKKYILRIFILVNVLLLVAVNAKINFLLSFFIINLIFLYYSSKYLNPKKFIWILFIFFLLIIFGLLPFVIWKSINYQYSIFHFFINPLPLNIPIYDNFFYFLKNYQSEKFPLILLLPLEVGDFTQIIGLGCLILYFLFNNKFRNKKFFILIILSFIFILYFFGQKTSRFYLEIFLFTILLFAQIIKNVEKHKFFIFFKSLIIFQTFIVIFSLTWSVINIFPGSFNSYLRDKVLMNYADGYSLIKWANSVLPENSKIIVGHRSVTFFNVDYINPEPLGYMTYNSIHKNYYLNKIKYQKPEFILFYGLKPTFNYGEFNFKNCVTKLFANKENVGFLATRNPLMTDRVMYNGYIYYFDSSRMPSCVKSN